MEVQSPHPAASPLKEPHRTIGFLWISLLAAVFLLAAYSNSFHQFFKLGDREFIEDNLYVQGLESIPQLFSDPREALRIPADVPYRPVLSLSLTFDYWMAGGGDPWQFHLTQFVLVALLGIGFAAIGQFVLDRAAIHWSNKYIALVAALLYCVHVANAETLISLSSRGNLLAMLGVVGSFAMYGRLPLWRPSHLYLLPMMLGTLAHPAGALFVPLLLVYGLLFEKRLSCREMCSPNAWPKIRHALGKVAPAFLTGTALLLFLDSVDSLQKTGNESVADTLLLQPFLWLYTAQRFFIPFGALNDMVWPVSLSMVDPRFSAGMIGLAIWGRIGWACSQTRELRPVTFGIMWCILGMFGAASTGDPEIGMPQPQVLFSFMGLTLSVMSWIAYQVQRCRWGFLGRQSLMIPMVCVLGLVVLAAHAVGTYQRHAGGFPTASPSEVSRAERPVPPYHRM